MHGFFINHRQKLSKFKSKYYNKNEKTLKNYNNFDKRRRQTRFLHHRWHLLLYIALACIGVFSVVLIISILTQTSDKYLLYYNHSGFSNQILAIERAAIFAMATNRTLVLPPMLPHKEKKIVSEIKKSGNYSKGALYEPRAAGNKCLPYHRYKSFLKHVKNDVKLAKSIVSKKTNNKDNKFPSFLEILDLSELTEHTGLQVMDMQEFVTMPFITSFFFTWCPGPMNNFKNEMREMFVPSCVESMQISFSQLVPFFERACGKARVALIGSAFVMPTPVEDDQNEDDDPYFSLELKNKFHEYIEGATPSPKMLKLLGSMYQLLPEGYVAVHIRFGDFLQIDDCDEDVVKKAYQDVLNGLAVEKDVKNGTQVLIGNGNKEAKRCFEHHAMGRYPVTTINDIISDHPYIQDLVNDIHTDKNNVYLFLDIILLSVAEHIVFSHAGVNANTFQSQIKFRHNRRKKTKELMLASLTPTTTSNN